MKNSLIHIACGLILSTSSMVLANEFDYLVTSSTQDPAITWQ